MRDEVLLLCEGVFPEAVARRRDLHRFPEPGWTEFRTASLSAAALAEAGWEVQVGEVVCAPAARMGVPGEAELEAAWEAALAAGGDAGWMQLMRGGFTGVVAILRGSRPGPTVALRFDLDALEVKEEQDPRVHLPAREGFVSQRPGLMHACGHDAHTALGVAVGQVLGRLKDRLRGTVRLVLQPAEEGVRGAASMVAAGVLEGVDYFLCPHVGAECRVTGEVLPGSLGFLATTKLDVWLTGREAHAGLAPEEGRNALLGAAQAVLGLHAIPRHRAGNSRVNVGVLRAGSGRNVIPGEAYMKVEVRSEETGVVEFLEQQARQVVAGAAAMWGLEQRVERVGAAPSARSDPSMIEVVARIASRLPQVRRVGDPVASGGSDDAAFMMRRVQEQQGQVAYLFLGTDLPSGHHTPRFDLDESCILTGLQLFTLATLELTGSLEATA